METPLDPPRDAIVLGTFLDHFGLERDAPARTLLDAAASAFSSLPYENLTKILKLAREGTPEQARRGPLEVISDHIESGAGGTCFSLTAALLHIVRALGWRAEPILADRHYGPDTHCALLIWIEGAPHLLDPGFLIHRPVAVDLAGETRIGNAFNEIILAPRDGGAKIDLITLERGAHSTRLTLKMEPADPGRFLRVWDESFGWDMMRYPLVTRALGGRHLYLKDSRLQVRGGEGSTRSDVAPDDLPGLIEREFGLAGAVAEKALSVLEAAS